MKKRGENESDTEHKHDVLITSGIVAFLTLNRNP